MRLASLKSQGRYALWPKEGRHPADDSGMRTLTIDPSQQRWADRSAVVVEFALVMPLLILILLGTITAGLALNGNLRLNH